MLSLALTLLLSVSGAAADPASTTAEPAQPKKICRAAPSTGSRLAKKICRTQEEWNKQDESARDYLPIQKSGGGI